MEDEIILPPTDDEWLDYYEESGLMKDYYAERQAEMDEMLLWQN